MARTNTNSGGGGGVTNVTATFPITSSGGATPDIGISQPTMNSVWYTGPSGNLTGDNSFSRNLNDDRFTWASNVNTDYGMLIS